MRTLLALAFAWAALLIAYRADWLAMATVWRTSDTFAHGMLVGPIAAWLAWRRRAELCAVPLRPWLAAWPLPVTCGLAWLAADLAGVAAPAQFAIVGMAVGTVAMIAGPASMRTLAFPLGFLFLMVPFGEFLTPIMMNHTADFTVAAVRASGVPVYREGLHFVLPSGRWSVVEACSGLRYLIASVVLGVLYAYLSYRSMRRRLAFVAAAIVVPVVANWLRAYGIVMLGHASDMRIAAGADHLVYGWVFFGVVMFALFWIGARWRDDRPAEAPGVTLRSRGWPEVVPTARFAATAALAVATVLAWPPIAAALLDRTVPFAFAERIGAALPDLRADDAPLGLRPSFSGARAERIGVVDASTPVGVFVAYYARQHEGTEMVRHGNVLVPADDATWRIVRSTPVDLSGPQGTVRAMRTELASASGPPRRLVVLHWFTVDGRHVASPHRAKLLTAASLLRGEGDHSIVVAVWQAQEVGARPEPSSEPSLQAIALRIAAESARAAQRAGDGPRAQR